MLVPWQSIRMRDVTDGTSNTLMVGEQSDFGVTSSGARVEINQHQGFLIGVYTPTFPDPANGNSRTFNMTTIRYAINSPNTALNGVNNNDGVNNGIFSAHVGGAHVLLADGSVRFLSENMNLFNLKSLATRDDGNVIGEF